MHRKQNLWFVWFFAFCLCLTFLAQFTPDIDEPTKVKSCLKSNVRRVYLQFSTYITVLLREWSGDTFFFLRFNLNIFFFLVDTTFKRITLFQLDNIFALILFRFHINYLVSRMQSNQSVRKHTRLTRCDFDAMWKISIWIRRQILNQCRFQTKTMERVEATSSNDIAFITSHNSSEQTFDRRTLRILCSYVYIYDFRF